LYVLSSNSFFEKAPGVYSILLEDPLLSEFRYRFHIDPDGLIRNNCERLWLGPNVTRCAALQIEDVIAPS
jgi:hypothetical protein